MIIAGPRGTACYDRRAAPIRETTMKNPLDSLWGTVIAGLVLTVVLYYLARAMMGG
jgi:hypothetical protein